MKINKEVKNQETEREVPVQLFCCAGSGRELPAARICAGAMVAVRRERTEGGYACERENT
jgi:hypothetical protein